MANEKCTCRVTRRAAPWVISDDEFRAEFNRLFDQFNADQRDATCRDIWNAVAINAYERGGAAEVARVRNELEGRHHG